MKSEQELRTQLGIYDGSYIGRILDNTTPWVGTDQDGEQIIYRSRPDMMAYAVHDIARYFARKKMDYSKLGRHVVEVTFNVYRHDDPTCEIKGITMKIPYEITVTYDARNERMDGNALARVNRIQNGKKLQNV